MNHIQPYDKVKIFFKNGIIIEGKVDTWTHKEAVLFNDENELFIIQDTQADVLCIKVTKPVKEKGEPLPPPNISQDLEFEEVDLAELEEEAKDIVAKPIDQLGLLKLSELKKLQAIQERKIIEGQLRSHNINQVQKVQYGTPRFFKK